MSTIKDLDALLAERKAQRFGVQEASSEPVDDLDSLLQKRKIERGLVSQQKSVNPAPVEQEQPEQSLFERAEGVARSISDYVTGDNRIEPKDRGLKEFNLGEAFVSTNLPPASRQKIVAGFMFTSDPDAKADILEEHFPDIEIERDKYNNPIVRYKREDGTEVREFLNTPGLSGRDLGNFAGDVALFLPAGGAAGLAKSILGRVAIGGAAGAATSVAADAAAGAAGSKQGVDLTKAGFVGLAMAGAETINPLVARISRLIRGRPGMTTSTKDGASKLTAKGKEFVRKQGIDPDEVTEALARRVQDQADLAVSPRGGAATAQADEFGISLTRGQATGARPMQEFEEAALQGARGASAQSTLSKFAQNQQQQVDDSIRLVQDKLLRDHSNFLSKELDAAGLIQDGIKEKAKQLDDAITAAYQPFNRGSAQLNVSSLSDLRKGIFEGLRNVNAAIDPDLTPSTMKALSAIRKVSKQTQAAGTKGIDIKRLEDLRRKFNLFIQGSKTPTDRMNTIVVKRQFDRWYNDAVDSALFSGDKGAIHAIKEGRSLRSLKGDLFEARTNRDKAGKVMERIIADDLTPEQISNYLIGRSKLGQAGESVQIIKRLKNIFPDGSQELDAIRQMTFLRLVRDGRGPRGNIQPGRLGNQISHFLERSPSLAKEVFTPQQRKVLKSYASVLRRISPESTNPSKSGFTAAREMRAMADNLLSAFGFATGNPALPVLGKLPGLTSAAKARAATSPLRGPIPRTTSLPAISGAAVSSQQGAE